ncbi:hypothetical protein [Nocardioides sp.]|uniref:hypothetical protein n=1 Tax=Nocardioides sp. TaxID=35761 RepID=UPI003569ACDC
MREAGLAAASLPFCSGIGGKTRPPDPFCAPPAAPLAAPLAGRLIATVSSF